MNAGSLDMRLQFLRATPVKDQRSGETLSETWSAAFPPVWGSLRAVSGSESPVAGQVVALSDVEFRIRWRDDIDTKMRIESEGVLYDIHSILPHGRRREALMIRGRRRAD